MLEEAIKLQGRTQVDVTQRITLPQQGGLSYTVDTYFFLPAELLINAHTYSGADFAKRLKTRIRLSCPQLPLEALTAPSGPLDDLLWSLAAAEEDARSAARSGEPESDERRLAFEAALKRYALLYERASKRAGKALAEETSAGRLDAAQLERIFALAKKARDAFRELEPRMKAIEARLGSRACEACDEFLSVSTANAMAKLAEALPKTLLAPLDRFWLEEKLYRESRYPGTIAASPADRERVLFRWRAVRKFVNRLLFLDIHYKEGSPLLLHSLYGVAAAVSMIFATIVAFVWQSRYGSLSLNLFFAMVLAYIFKDRIKEVMRARLQHLFRRWIPDRRLEITHSGGFSMGECEESFDFMKPQELPREVAKMRADAREAPFNFLNRDRSEEILRYRKRVHLHPNPEVFARSSHRIVDITRFNIADFLGSIDSLYSELPDLDLDEPEPGRIAKTYHIYMARTTRIGERASTDLTRLLVTADGIRALDPLVTAMPL